MNYCRESNRTTTYTAYKCAKRIKRKLYKTIRHTLYLAYKHIRKYSVVYRFLLSKAFAIAMLAIGLHCMWAYIVKDLPFGIESSDLALWAVWAYMGYWISVIPIGYGATILLEEKINRWINRF